MTTAELLIDAFRRVEKLVHRVTDGLDESQLTWQPGPEANTVSWLIWHLTRIQDDHIAHLADVEQSWTSGGWYGRFGLPFDPSDTGYGHSPEEVAALRVHADLLTAYHDAVHDLTVEYLETIDEAELDRIVDESWDPPVTAGIRIVSVLGDTLQHCGQAAYVRGLLPS